MPFIYKVLIAGGVLVVLGGGAWLMKQFGTDSDSFDGARSLSKKPRPGDPNLRTKQKKDEPQNLDFDFWRKVIEKSAREELVSAMNALYSNGQEVSIEQVFSFAESGGLSGDECSAAINAVVAAANGKLEIVTVREGDRWDNRTMQSEDNEVPPAAYVTEVLSAGLKMMQDGRIIVKAMVKLASKTDTGVL